MPKKKIGERAALEWAHAVGAQWVHLRGTASDTPYINDAINALLSERVPLLSINQFKAVAVLIHAIARLSSIPHRPDVEVALNERLDEARRAWGEHLKQFPRGA